MDRLWHGYFRRPAQVPVLRFDPGRQRWVAARETAGPGHVERLTVTTYNIWFNDHHAGQRHRTIAELLSRESPDIMVFQEVTPDALAVFLAQPWIQERYRSAAAVGGRRGNYGMLLLSGVPVDTVTYTPLPTRLSRGYLTAQLTVNGERLTVVGIHLESGKASAPVRARQLARIFASQRDAENVVMLGDFNIRDAEDAIIDPGYRDVWPALRPGEPGYTEDTTINHMRFDMKDKHRHVRFDRVLTTGDAWAPESIELLGREPISPALPRVFPSDHFGVRCELRRR